MHMLIATFQSQAPDPNLGDLKIKKIHLNFASLTSASQQWVPALSERIIEIELLCIEISCLQNYFINNSFLCDRLNGLLGCGNNINDQSH